MTSVAAQTARILFTFLWKNKKNFAKARTRARIYSIRPG
jgi:hypothetical protein